jgi:hypothetical protein
MFWNTTGNRQSEPNLTHNFMALINEISLNPVLDPSYTRNGEDEFQQENVFGQSLKVLVKNISAPSVGIEFERAYANQYVHYFQNGSLHWEPIEVVFYDYKSSISNLQTNGNDFTNLRLLLFKYLSQNLINEQNRTKVIELPIFANEIDILSVTTLKTEIYSNYGFKIKNPRISKINFGRFDYTSSDINQISVTLIPEWCDYIDPVGSEFNEAGDRSQRGQTFGLGSST